MADKVAIAGGTQVLAKLLGSVGQGAISTATVIPELESMGDISEQTAEVQATPLSSKTVRYIAGLNDGQPLELTMFLLTDSAVQKALHDAWKTRGEIELTVQPDDTVEQYRFNWRPTSHMIRTGSGGDPKRRVMSGRVNSAVIDEPNTLITP